MSKRRGPKAIEYRRGHKLRITTMPDAVAMEGDLAVAGAVTTTGAISTAGTISHPTSGEFVGLVTAATEPTLTAGQWCIWVDSDDDSTYLVVHNGAAQVKTAALS